MTDRCAAAMVSFVFAVTCIAGCASPRQTFVNHVDTDHSRRVETSSRPLKKPAKTGEKESLLSQWFHPFRTKKTKPAGEERPQAIALPRTDHKSQASEEFVPF